MSTIANVLDLMEVLDNSLATGAAEADEFRGIITINAAQSLLDSLLASETHLVNSRTPVNTVANTEATAFPVGMLRLAQIQALDTTVVPTRIQYTLTRIFDTGGHGGGGTPWPILAGGGTSTGKPRSYSVDGSTVLWGAIPDAIYPMRFCGYTATASYAARANTFLHADHVMLPMAVMASKILRIGVDASTTEITDLARDVFGPTVLGFKRTARVRGAPRQYSESHST